MPLTKENALMDIMYNIRRRQQALSGLMAGDTRPPKHEPELLYVGCIDARLDPIEDIGIEQGRALIFRNIAALVLKDGSGHAHIDTAAALASGEIPPNTSIGAALEFFLRHIPLEQGHIKHIIVSGHTDCGGIKACSLGTGQHDHYLPLYLESLKGVRSRVIQEAKAHNWNEAETLQALEQESVRQSMSNLLTYPAVREAIEKNTLELHGWIINTATKRIAEMNPATLEFEPMRVDTENAQSA